MGTPKARRNDNASWALILGVGLEFEFRVRVFVLQCACSLTDRTVVACVQPALAQVAPLSKLSSIDTSLTVKSCRHTNCKLSPHT